MLKGVDEVHAQDAFQLHCGPAILDNFLTHHFSTFKIPQFGSIYFYQEQHVMVLSSRLNILNVLLQLATILPNFLIIIHIFLNVGDKFMNFHQVVLHFYIFILFLFIISSAVSNFYLFLFIPGIHFDRLYFCLDLKGFMGEGG